MQPTMQINEEGYWVPIPVAAQSPPGARDVSTKEGCWHDFRSDYFAFVITVEDVDCKRRTASARVLAYPSSRFDGLLGSVRLPPGVVLSLSLNGGTPEEWTDGDAFISGIPKKTDAIPVTGDPELSFYPYDKYFFSIAMILKFINTTDNNATSFVPFVAIVETRNPAFSFYMPQGDIQTVLLTSSSGFVLDVHVSRTSFAKAFSGFLFVSMWVLSIFAAVHALDVAFVRPRRVVPFDAAMFAATMLFALPAVRQVQPGIPEVGILIDITGFFWNMMLLALACCIYISMTYGQHVRSYGEPEKPPEEALVLEPGERSRRGRKLGPTASSVAVVQAGEDAVGDGGCERHGGHGASHGLGSAAVQVQMSETV
ncbi:hypothetical protein GPECTOR_26g513 [Gonium pectorale]|uniref:Uncharacterized protein n=1 Tax=Gonium pectorale TaxID=33097 RepID=A0A150GGW3_GONPE|nr:hypothetical protein GPECTOR_26g513 [Gonium pectorale]|eukprot:KXZ48610.1 hypothetical protein GPECTOR_26g513 [Gonium pectorale]